MDLRLETVPDRENRDFLVAAHALALEQGGETRQAMQALAVILSRRDGEMTCTSVAARPGGGRAPPPAGKRSPPTEVKIAALVARGDSTPDIACGMFLSRRTVQTYISHVLVKLDASSRVDIVREALRQGVSPWPRDSPASVPALEPPSTPPWSRPHGPGTERQALDLLIADVQVALDQADAVAARVARVGAGVVARPGLFGRLGAARVTVVAAHAGSGKTVLLRSWISQACPVGCAACGCWRTWRRWRSRCGCWSMTCTSWGQSCCGSWRC